MSKNISTGVFGFQTGAMENGVPVTYTLNLVRPVGQDQYPVSDREFLAHARRVTGGCVTFPIGG